MLNLLELKNYRKMQNRYSHRTSSDGNGLFGYGYDVIRLIENLPNTNNDALGVPDIRLIRPTVLIVLDSIVN